MQEIEKLFYSYLRDTVHFVMLCTGQNTGKSSEADDSKQKKTGATLSSISSVPSGRSGELERHYGVGRSAQVWSSVGLASNMLHMLSFPLNFCLDKLL